MNPRVRLRSCPPPEAYVALAITTERDKEILGVSIEKTEGARLLLKATKGDGAAVNGNGGQHQGPAAGN